MLVGAKAPWAQWRVYIGCAKSRAYILYLYGGALAIKTDPLDWGFMTNLKFKWRQKPVLYPNEEKKEEKNREHIVMYAL